MSRRNLKQEHRRNKREPNVQDQLYLQRTTRNLVRPRPPVTYNAHGVACSYHSKRAAHVAHVAHVAPQEVSNV